MELKERADRLNYKRQFITEELEKCLGELDTLIDEKDKYKRATAICQQVAQEIQESICLSLSGIVNQALSTIFPEPYCVDITFGIKRNNPEAYISFKRDGYEIDPIDSSGGGVCDVAAFALRLACYLISTERPRNLFIMDEPFKFVSAEYMPAIPEMIKELSDQLGIKFVIVTHEPEVAEYDYDSR